MSVVAIIPARIGGKRLPGKALAEIDGLPLVVHVMRRAAEAQQVDRVIVATDHKTIAQTVREHGGEARMTRGDHMTGTDRVAEVARELEASYIINVQGDNLALDPGHVDAVATALCSGKIPVVTPVTPFPDELDVTDASKVKVVLSEDNRALYFSRQPVPSRGPWWLHIGIYGFRKEVLGQFAAWPQGRLEISEGLEQLRLIEHGIEIHTVGVARAAASIDTPRDLALARSARSSSSTLRH